mgnify:FL=1
MLYLQRCEAPQAFLKLNVRVGSQVPIISSGTGWGYLAGLAPDVRKQVMQECRKADPALYRNAEKHATAALADYPKAGYVTNVDTFFPGLSTVSLPLAITPVPYVLICTSASSVFADPKVLDAAGKALMAVADHLRPVIDRMPRD